METEFSNMEGSKNGIRKKFFKLFSTKMRKQNVPLRIVFLLSKNKTIPFKLMTETEHCVPLIDGMTFFSSTYIL